MNHLHIMKRTLLLLVFALHLTLGLKAGETVFYSGYIGSYEIEMELHPVEADDHNVEGRYRYKGKTAYLDLQGDYYPGGVMRLEESWNGKISGTFYIEHSDEGAWSGKWINETKWHEVELMLESGDQTSLEPYNIWEKNEQTNSSITGSYVDLNYFVNDMWFSDEERILEIGFNGGVVSVEELSPDSIHIIFNLTCGPTYHIAWMDGKAVKIGNRKYEFISTEFDEEPCHLQFEFGEGKMNIIQKSSGFACGFGARAYAEGEFLKVNDQPVAGEEPTVEGAMGE